MDPLSYSLYLFFSNVISNQNAFNLSYFQLLWRALDPTFSSSAGASSWWDPWLSWSIECCRRSHFTSKLFTHKPSRNVIKPVQNKEYEPVKLRLYLNDIEVWSPVFITLLKYNFRHYNAFYIALVTWERNIVHNISYIDKSLSIS